MLSVLPTAEGVCWEGGPRKRGLPQSCPGEYASVASRAKRLRQELLRLREAEQVRQVESMGCEEGQGDSCDASLCVEPQWSMPLHPSVGPIRVVEDAADATSASPSATSSSARKCPYADCGTPRSFPGPGSDPGLFPGPPKSFPRPASSNPNPATDHALGPWAPADPLGRTLAPVHTRTTVSAPEHALFVSAPRHAAEEEPSAAPEASDAEEEEDQEWSLCYDISGSSNPLRDLFAATSGEASVQCRAEDTRLVAGQLAPQRELEQEQESEECEREAGGEAAGQAAMAASGLVCPLSAPCAVCASALSSLVLPPLPHSFLGQPMPQRLRLLHFLTQAAEQLGLGVRALYLALALLDCACVEERLRGSPRVDSSQLKCLTAACLLHAHRSFAASPLTCEEVCARLNRSGHCAAFGSGPLALPLWAAAVEQQLRCLPRLLPLATAHSSLSSSSWLFGSMLELRGCCSQKEHLAVSVAQLCSLGVPLPSSILLSANCCLQWAAAAGAGAWGHAAVLHWPHVHHTHHLEALQAFLCGSESQSGCSVPHWGAEQAAGTEAGWEGAECKFRSFVCADGACSHAAAPAQGAAAVPEASLEISV